MLVVICSFLVPECGCYCGNCCVVRSRKKKKKKKRRQQQETSEEPVTGHSDSEVCVVSHARYAGLSVSVLVARCHLKDACVM